MRMQMTQGVGPRSKARSEVEESRFDLRIPESQYYRSNSTRWRIHAAISCNTLGEVVSSICPISSGLPVFAVWKKWLSPNISITVVSALPSSRNTQRYQSGAMQGVSDHSRLPKTSVSFIFLFGYGSLHFSPRRRRQVHSEYSFDHELFSVCSLDRFRQILWPEK